VTYDLEVYGYLDFVYGEDNIIEIYLPDYLNNKLLKVEINGTKYKFARPAYTGNNMVEVNVSKLLAGSYSMFISYPGDARFKAKSKTVNFTVRYETISPYDAVYGDNCYVKLYLPKDAKGTLNLYVDGKLYKSAKVTNGKALINLKGIREGHHMINATYAGDDYDVSPSSSSLFVRFKFKIAYTFTAGEKKYVSVQVSKSSKGYVIFYIDDSPHRVNVKNGIARYSLKGLREGEYEITADYFDEEGFADSEYAVITVYEPRLKIVSSKLYVSGANVKVKVLNNNKKPMAKVYVKIRLNGRNYWVKTNKKGIATVKKSLKLKAKKYRLTVSCNGAKISKVIKAKHIISLKSVKVKKSAKRLVITAKVITKFKKGSKVTFKFNGKTYKAKLNRNGIAKLTIKKQVLKKLRAGAKVRYQATYLKDTVKRTAKVKR
jgi:hypothetical protein